MIPLFCIASGHSIAYTYNWSNTDGDVGIDSTVLYVARTGTYSCTVDNGIQQCRSHAITVVEGSIYNTLVGTYNSVLLFP